MRDAGTRRHGDGDTEMRRHGDASCGDVPVSPRPRVAPSPRRPVPASPCGP